jgi:hypothetical protein
MSHADDPGSDAGAENLALLHRYLRAVPVQTPRRSATLATVNRRVLSLKYG